MYNYSSRCVNEVNSYHTASFLLNQISNVSSSWSKATKMEDVGQAIDLRWSIYNIAVRERTFTATEFQRYKDDITIRGTGEIYKLMAFPVDGIVYIRRNRQMDLLGYSIVSCAKLRTYLSSLDLKNPDWHKKTNGSVTLINYGVDVEPFYVFDLSRMQSIILYHKC